MNDEDKSFVIDIKDMDGMQLANILVIGYENAKRHLKYEIEKLLAKCFVAKLYEVEE